MKTKDSKITIKEKVNRNQKVRQEGKNNRKSKYRILITFFETFIVSIIVGVLVLYGLYTQKKEISVIDFLILEKDTIVKTITNQDNTTTLEKEEMPTGWQIDTKDSNEVTLLFAGDVLLDDSYAVMSTYLQKGSSLQNSFSDDLITEMQSADIFMLNNEFTFTDRGEPTVGKQYTFRAKPDAVSVLKDMGVDIVTLANNHAYDYGEISLTDTLDTLNDAQIQYVGAGMNAEEAAKVVYANANGIKIAFVGATQIEKNPTPDTKGATDSNPGVFRCNNPDKLIEVIKEAKENSDFVVLYIHWGTESTATIDDLQKTQAPLYTDAGADLIIGDHSHCLQQITYQNHVPIIYSMSNFWFNSKSIDTCLIKVTLKQDGMTWQFLPCRQEGCKTILLDGQEKDRVMEYMRSISPDVTITPEGYITELE